MHQNEMRECLAPETACHAVRFDEIEEHETSLDDYLEDLARWEDEADGCEGEGGFDEDEIERSSDGETAKSPF
jgi:hypothetical protein